MTTAQKSVIGSPEHRLGFNVGESEPAFAVSGEHCLSNFHMSRLSVGLADIALVVFGSLARLEWTSGSDKTMPTRSSHLRKYLTAPKLIANNLQTFLSYVFGLGHLW